MTKAFLICDKSFSNILTHKLRTLLKCDKEGILYVVHYLLTSDYLTIFLTTICTAKALRDDGPSLASYVLI